MVKIYYALATSQFTTDLDRLRRRLRTRFSANAGDLLQFANFVMAYVVDRACLQSAEAVDNW